MIGTTLYSIYFLFRPKNPLNAYLVTHGVCGLALKILGLKVRLIGEEKLYKVRPCVFISNHQTTIDVFVFGSIFPKETFVVAKKSLKYTPFFGWAYSLSGNQYIDRQNKDQAINVLASAEKYMLEKRKAIFLFPEGTRSRGKGLGKFKKGAFHVARNTKSPLVPVVASHYDFDLNKWNAGEVVVKVFDPIWVEDNSDIDSIVLKTEELFKNYLAESMKS